ncbi:hypothetical protein MSIMFI_04914 [Mycobacterium simulans]|uniref:hypothetical protein n=1 Tax=Mycobacterium simulans TaxID=627089 RepID=UPI00174D16F9|nr:hypothetical protein [Mycobacterium simulans]SON63384.1 hypothetical protein MSIMFI_04914 [Mycobacterium simulans]
MTAALTETPPSTPGICWDCGGPCLTHKGTVHKWRCRSCLDRYLEDAAARGEAKAHKTREKLLRKAFHGLPVEGRRGGGGTGCGPHRHRDDEHHAHQERRCD